MNDWRWIDLLSAIGRTLVPRYFRSIFEGGVTDLYYILKHSKESFHNTSITLDCDQATMITHHGKPMFTKVRAGASSETFLMLILIMVSFCMYGTVALWHDNLNFPVYRATDLHLLGSYRQYRNLYQFKEAGWSTNDLSDLSWNFR